MTKAMIMAAGVGSRLEPLTLDVPKPLVPIANKPVMDILLENLAKIGVQDVISNTYYLAEQVINRYKINNFGIIFNYIKEETLSGTAGGFKKCQKFFNPEEDFFVLSADGLHNADLMKAMEIHKNSGAIATIGIKQVEESEVVNFGVVVTDENGYITEFQEKPAIKDAKSNFINTGIYIFNYKIFDYIPENQFYDFAKNVFPKLLKDSQINTFEVNEYWSDIGTLEQYKQSTQDLFKGEVTFDHSKIIEKPIGKYISGKSYIAPSVEFIGNTTIGDGCIIGRNVVLENCIIWNDVEIADNSVLKNCVIASHSEINAKLTNQIIGSNQVITEGIYK